MEAGMNRLTNKSGVCPKVAILLALISVPVLASGALADPFKLGVEDSTTLPGQGTYQYPAPQMVTPARPMQAAVQSNAMQGNVMQARPAPPPPQRPPMQLGVQRQVALPPGYLGLWRVMGQRTTVEAQPEFQQDADRAFAQSTNNVWEISGSPGSYSMGNGSISTQLYVDRVGADGTAFIRYQHPMGKTMAQEAIVMTLTPNGLQFNGLERISIVKEGYPQPRAKVTYQLVGQRQR
jgi:hypothetical protein